MAKKEFTYRGKSIDELKSLTHKEFAQLATTATRRSILRGFRHTEKELLKDIKNGKKNIETHARDMIVLPEMIDAMIKVHNGKSFELVVIQPEMIGHALGEFALTRKRVGHSSPGVGATQAAGGAKKK